jgi:hypothetical protein
LIPVNLSVSWEENKHDISETCRKPFKQFETMFQMKIWRIWSTFCWVAALLN